jgi:hypothetical protein
VERGYQPRLIALSIVPNYLWPALAGAGLSIVKVTTEYPANGSSSLDLSHTAKEENMVKPHG